MNLLSRFNTGISVVIFAACCVAFIAFGVSGTGWKALSIPTGSMRPGMPPGSLALVHRVPDSSLKVGDVITYANPLRPGTTLSHRIIKKILIGGKIPGFVTKGDANKFADVPIAAGAVEGKVVWHIPHAGKWLLWGKTWTGLAILVYTPALLIVLEEIIQVNAYYKSLIPYTLFGYRFEPKKEPNGLSKKLAIGTSAALAIMFVAGIAAPVADALLTSNTVTLTNNQISAAAVQQQCSGNTNNNTSINVNNTSTQTSQTGSVTNSGNTNGGSSTSGSVTNTNNTNVNVTVTNCP